MYNKEIIVGVLLLLVCILSAIYVQLYSELRERPIKARVISMVSTLLLIVFSGALGVGGFYTAKCFVYPTTNFISVDVLADLFYFVM